MKPLAQLLGGVKVLTKAHVIVADGTMYCDGMVTRCVVGSTVAGIEFGLPSTDELESVQSTLVKVKFAGIEFSSMVTCWPMFVAVWIVPEVTLVPAVDVVMESLPMSVPVTA